MTVDAASDTGSAATAEAVEGVAEAQEDLCDTVCAALSLAAADSMSADLSSLTFTFTQDGVKVSAAPLVGDAFEATYEQADIAKAISEFDEAGEPMETE